MKPLEQRFKFATARADETGLILERNDQEGFTFFAPEEVPHLIKYLVSVISKEAEEGIKPTHSGVKDE